MGFRNFMSNSFSMSQSIFETNFNLPGQTSFYRGKVRDVYTINDRTMVMIASDRISCFDIILPRTIPWKGQVLNQIAVKFLRATEDILPNWLEQSPDPNVSMGKICDPFRIEMVIRGYVTGHAWRVYRSGERMLCGVPLPDGLNENDRLPEPIITPATKAESGHDEDISREDILKQGIVSESDYVQLEEFTRQLFQRGSEMAAKRGLILVDTKYEFGKIGDQIYLIDEVHTPDSSRYFYADGYEERQAAGEKQKHLSKEFVRQWLIDHGFQGLDGQEMPEIPDEFVESVTSRYIELYEQLTGENFVRAETDDIYNRVEGNVLNAITVLQ